MNVLRIAVRNVTRQKKRSILLGGAIAFGVMIITLIGSFTQGITNTASAKFTDMLGGQIYITGQELTATGATVSVIRDRSVIEDAIARTGIQIAERTVRTRTMGEIIFGSKTTMTSLEGVDWIDEPNLVDKLDVIKGSVSQEMSERALVIPAYTAEELGVEVGETVLIRTSTVTGQQNVAEFEIQAVTRQDSMFSFSAAYADRAYLNGLIGLGPADYQILNIALRDPLKADEATNVLLTYLRSIGRAEPEQEDEQGAKGMHARMTRMMSLFGGSSLFSSRVDEADRWQGTRFSVLNINDMMESVNSMVSVLNTVSYVIFIVLLVITMVGLLNTFRMVLIERTNEIGMMRAIGMQRKEVRNIFLSEALTLALGGTVAGLVIAFILSGVLSVIPISSDTPLQFFLMDNSFVFPVVPAKIVLTLLIISLVTLTAAYFPARKAAKLDPAVALRAVY